MDDLRQELTTATWRKSTLSGSDGTDCVEIARLTGGHIGVRDSKNPTAPALLLTPGDWNTFIEGIKSGQFD
ncbi:DUF397 domain-containing protein [Streptosporangium carneum]|uniref:DUF397 domain-containing protein n=1 Tax=Streptosporangium carneum TaxID=47481 RepID=A0A9W6I7D1_9ACTN|nr:DUF397 domain-containing protein [Streptosporangium carneum]GLK12978.1 hypothetical protein GCM10017600_63880 [Streptosporangium carneum]